MRSYVLLVRFFVCVLCVGVWQFCDRPVNGSNKKWEATRKTGSEVKVDEMPVSNSTSRFFLGCQNLFVVVISITLVLIRMLL